MSGAGSGAGRETGSGTVPGGTSGGEIAEHRLACEALFADVAGQAGPVDQLRRAALRPMHAYLIVGPAGSGKHSLAVGFAAALLCPDGGCGACGTCRRVLAGVHPDLVEVERAGSQLGVEDVRKAIRASYDRPVESARQVVVLRDLHLARLAAPMLLKTLEEPPGESVFVLLAEHLSPELVTVASRCVQIELTAATEDEIASWLLSRGFPQERALAAASAAHGNAGRAWRLAGDPGFSARRDAWRSVPARLDGTGATAWALASELSAAVEESLEPLRARHREELEEIGGNAPKRSERSSTGRRQAEERHHRLERRYRTEELRVGLGELAASYRDRLTTGSAGGASTRHVTSRTRSTLVAIETIEVAAQALERNANEMLLMEALMVALSDLPTDG